MQNLDVSFLFGEKCSSLCNTRENACMNHLPDQLTSKIFHCYLVTLLLFYQKQNLFDNLFSVFHVVIFVELIVCGRMLTAWSVTVVGVAKAVI